MNYKSETTRAGKGALVNAEGKTVHIYEHPAAAMMAADIMNKVCNEVHCPRCGGSGESPLMAGCVNLITCRFCGGTGRLPV